MRPPSNALTISLIFKKGAVKIQNKYEKVFVEPNKDLDTSELSGRIVEFRNLTTRTDYHQAKVIALLE